MRGSLKVHESPNFSPLIEEHGNLKISPLVDKWTHQAKTRVERKFPPQQENSPWENVEMQKRVENGEGAGALGVYQSEYKNALIGVVLCV
jgi:hypothetical protein